MYCVYKHTCPNGKVYIGITGKNPLERWKGGHGYSNNKHFTNAINKYGWENIKHEILFDGLTKQEAEQKEIELIATHNSSKTECGYNQSTGGENSAAGCKWTQEHKTKTSKSLQGHFVSQSTKEKIRAARTKQTNVKNPPTLFGSKNFKSRKVCLRNENAVLHFNTVREAAAQIGVCHQSVSDCCRGKLKTVKGYCCFYEDLL